jgi:sigma-B regulation protein RsbU (phosphoserine phosphatase)
MDQQLIKRNRFKRGQDRRIRGDDSDEDLRQNLADRRQRGPCWLSLFREIDESIINTIIADFEVFTFSTGTLLLKPGDKNNCIYLLLSGQIVAHFDKLYNPAAAMPIQPGECIGEFSAIDGKPVSAFVRVLEDARVLQISPEAFWEQLMPIPGVARNLMVALTERMRRSNEITLEAHRKQIALQYLQQELKVARQLQEGMLPHRPFFPDRINIEIAGMMEAASEIGGDLFDAFMVNEHLLFFSIGDVSGHGIPAAMFMARTISLMRVAAISTNQPDELLERINQQLCQGNDAEMFVTVFCGFYYVNTGRLVYSNAGHLAPIYLNQRGVSPLSIPKGLMVGVFPEVKYKRDEIILGEGEAIICFTDGVTEAQSEHGQEFTEERLLQITLCNAQYPLEDLLKCVRQEVAHFTGNKLLDDDCTLLAIRRSVSD